MSHVFDTDHWNQRHYHNERIYWNFEFFVKVTIAICGGFAYLAVKQPKVDLGMISTVVTIGALLEIATGAISILHIIFHLKSKWDRLDNKPPSLSRKIWTWSETYTILFIFFLSLGIALAALIKLR